MKRGAGHKTLITSLYIFVLLVAEVIRGIRPEHVVAYVLQLALSFYIISTITRQNVHVLCHISLCTHVLKLFKIVTVSIVYVTNVIIFPVQNGYRSVFPF